MTTASRHTMRASTLELFFDLVFVFGITQVSTVFRSGRDLESFGQGLMLLLMLAWTWVVFSWITNFTGTDRPAVRFSLIAAMGASLVMATGVAGAFGDDGLWFAVPLFLVRVAAQAGYWFGTGAELNAALRTYLPLAFVAPAFVLAGGFVDDPVRTWLWLVAIAVDIGSAITAGRGEWDVAPGHFAERYGLFVIIALGESIVAIGIGALSAQRTVASMAALVVGFIGTAALWWSYFAHLAEKGERYLQDAPPKERGRFARDAYSILHFPIILGIVLFSVAVENVVAHPLDVIPGFERIAMAAGLALVLLAVVAATYRAVRQIPYERIVAAGLLGFLALVVTGVDAVWFMTATVVVVIAALVAEQPRTRRMASGRPRAADAA
jgi:low temperature requirement protein LtrA